MTQKERIAQLEQENAELRAQLAEAHEQITQLAERLQRVEGQLAKDSHNSSKPPSSDGPRRRPHSQRRRSEKPTGGQPGHAGGTLMQVASPDEVVRHRPMICPHCQQPLESLPGQLKERRQVHDLPEIRLVVREHQVEEVCCPACQQLSRGSFPVGVEAPVQYGPKMRALAVYLHEYQLVPLARVSELLADLCGCDVSEGSLLRWVECAAERLAPVVAQIADWLSVSPLQHADETGMRIAGKLHWVHVNSTRFLTHLAWHTKRGRRALEDIGIWPRFRGRSVRDRWVSYDHYHCAQSICGAHVVRDCVYVSEQEQQDWAAEMADLLLSMAKATDQWRRHGAHAVPAEERDAWVAQYFDLLASGFAAQPPPSAEDVPKRRGRRKQSAAKNLLDELLRRAEQVLAFLDDLSIPFTNNQAERDLRMVKVQQKIAGTFRSEDGATAFCRIRSYLSTMRKQGHAMLAALAAVFVGQPMPIAWAPK
jgi:transposase